MNAARLAARIAATFAVIYFGAHATIAAGSVIGAFIVAAATIATATIVWAITAVDPST